MSSNYVFYAVLQVFTFISIGNGAQIPSSSKYSKSSSSSSKSTSEATVKIQCLSGSMLITIKNAPSNNELGLFSGMIYPKGLSKNSTCLTEYRNHEGPLRYKLPLRSCNTMPQETDDGNIEFFNTIVLQPHLKLVTDLGRGYHVRCRYQSRNAATNNHPSSLPGHSKTKYAENPQAYRSDNENKDENDLIKIKDRRDHSRSLDKSEIIYVSTNNVEDEKEILLNYINNDDGNEIPMPGCHMKIYNNDKIAESVKIGDPLTLVVNIDEQNVYGLHVTDCLVRDGLGWGEQRLINEEGCPMDQEIMGLFIYSDNRTAARVTFPAHKFPYTASVYYQCNVRLCDKTNAECNESPSCGSNNKRLKRQTDSKDDEGMPATIEVYSGLYVNENVDVSDSSSDSVVKEISRIDDLCIPQKNFAIAIAVAGLILMLAVVAAVLCIMARRRTKSISNSGSSIYSGPYTNTAFSHSS